MLRRFQPAVRENLIAALVIASLIGNLLLTGLIYGARSRETAVLHKLRATQTSALATQAAQREQRHADVVARCRQGNTFRSQDLELWTKVLSLSGSTRTEPRTPAEEQAALDFQAYLIQHDALTDCSTL